MPEQLALLDVRPGVEVRPDLELLRELELSWPGERVRYELPRSARLAARWPARTRTSEWAERHFPVVEGAMRGPWRNRNNPALTGILDTWDDPHVEDLTVCAAVQMGKSKVLEICLAKSVDQDPGPALLGFPDENAAEEVVEERIRPIFEASPVLARQLTGRADDLSKKRIRLRSMPIYVAWSGSAQRWAAKAIKYLLLDEVDNYRKTAGRDVGSPLDLGRRRQRTFRYGRKGLYISSPTTETGNIWTLVNEAQVVFSYHVPCLSCGTHQVMQFGDYEHLEAHYLRWPKDVRDWRRVKHEKLAWYECRQCGAHWTDQDKAKAIQLGEWRDQATGIERAAYLRSRRPTSVAFRLAAYNAPYVSLSDIAATFLRAMSLEGEERNIALRDFFNNYEALPSRTWRPRRKTAAILRLRDERPRGRVPGGGAVACLVAGADTQEDGFYWRIRAVGYGEAEESWGVDEGFAPLDFGALEEVLWRHEYRDAEGAVYPVRLTVIDAMGHHTKAVYEWSRKHPGKVHPLQGKDHLPTPVSWSNIEYWPGTKKPIPGGVKLLRADVTFFKNALATKLQTEPEHPGAMHLHAETTEEYARHMAAEVYDEEKGLWICGEKTANHFWDCEVYVQVAAYVLRVRQWPRPDASAIRRTSESSSNSALSGRLINPWQR